MNELESLAREVGVSKRTLVRAFGDGTLRGHRSSPRKLTFPLREKQYVRNSWEMIASLKSALRTEHNVRFALLFGSASRGDEGPESDLDLLVEMKDSSFERVLDLEIKLETLLGRSVDLVLVEAAKGNSVLLAAAIDEGRLIVDRDDRWSRIRRTALDLERRSEREQAERTRDVLSGIDRLLAR
jgi:predicted nucleotidyltransferase